MPKFKVSALRSHCTGNTPDAHQTEKPFDQLVVGASRRALMRVVSSIEAARGVQLPVEAGRAVKLLGARPRCSAATLRGSKKAEVQGRQVLATTAALQEKRQFFAASRTHYVGHLGYPPAWPNQSVKARPNGVAPGPRGSAVYHLPHGPGSTPSVPPYLQR